MNTNPHHLFADDMWGIEHAQLTAEEKAILTADYTPADRHEGTPYTAHRALPLPERHYTAPQGCPEQGWPVRRCSPELHVIDRLPEEYDPDDQSESADGEFLRWLGRMAVYGGGVCFLAWLANALVKAV